MKVLSLEYIKTILKVRVQDSHKGTFGHALLFAGSKGRMGAAVISSKACLRSGVGLLTAISLKMKEGLFKRVYQK